MRTAPAKSRFPRSQAGRRLTSSPRTSARSPTPTARCSTGRPAAICPTPLRRPGRRRQDPGRLCRQGQESARRRRRLDTLLLRRSQWRRQRNHQVSASRPDSHTPNFTKAAPIGGGFVLHLLSLSAPFPRILPLFPVFCRFLLLSLVFCPFLSLSPAFCLIPSFYVSQRRALSFPAAIPFPAPSFRLCQAISTEK